MRDLARPEVIKPTACAALVTAVLCLPRLSLWTNRAYPIWYLEATIFTAAFVLWGFVFAWHSKYTGRPVFTLNLKAGGFAFATVAGLCGAGILSIFIDPVARRVMPEDFPADLRQWLAAGLFTLSLSQLLLVFVPVAWLMRLFKRQTIAFTLTVLFGLLIFVLKVQRAPAPMAPGPFVILLLTRLIMEILAVGVYLRGGVLATVWLGFLVHLHFWP